MILRGRGMLAGKTMDVVEVGTVGGMMISGVAKGETLLKRSSFQTYNTVPPINSIPL